MKESLLKLVKATLKKIELKSLSSEFDPPKIFKILKNDITVLRVSGSCRKVIWLILSNFIRVFESWFSQQELEDFKTLILDSLYKEFSNRKPDIGIVSGLQKSLSRILNKVDLSIEESLIIRIQSTWLYLYWTKQHRRRVQTHSHIVLALPAKQKHRIRDGHF